MAIPGRSSPDQSTAPAPRETLRDSGQALQGSGESLRDPSRLRETSGQASPTGLKDLLTVGDVPRDQLFRLFDLARELKTAPRTGQATQRLAGLTLGLLFEKPSTRTRVSFEVGMNQSGGRALFLPAEEIQYGRGESLADTALVLSRYLDGLVIRTFEQATLEEWARRSTIPVINGLTDLCHPCQAIADLFTIMEAKGRSQWPKTSDQNTGHGPQATSHCLEGLKLAYLGDGNNVANSLIEAGAKVGMHVAIGCHPDYQPDPGIIERSREDAAQTGATLVVTHDPIAAVEQADVLYTDVWTSMGKEHEQRERVNALAPYQLNARLLERAKPSAIVLHCLPAHRGEEITAEVLDGPQSVVVEQAENRLHVQKAILTEWLGRS